MIYELRDTDSNKEAIDLVVLLRKRIIRLFRMLLQKVIDWSAIRGVIYFLNPLTSNERVLSVYSMLLYV